jgi:hypothetical protein
MAAMATERLRDDDDDQPRMNWPEEAPSATPAAEPGPRQSESMARRALNAVSGTMRRMSFTAGSGDAGAGGVENRGSSLSRFFGGGSGDSARGSSLSRIFVGEQGDLRSGSIGRLVFSESSDGKMKAFRNVRKLASMMRKTMTGQSSSEAAEALAASRRFQQVPPPLPQPALPGAL